MCPARSFKANVRVCVCVCVRTPWPVACHRFVDAHAMTAHLPYVCSASHGKLGDERRDHAYCVKDKICWQDISAWRKRVWLCGLLCAHASSALSPCLVRAVVWIQYAHFLQCAISAIRRVFVVPSPVRSVHAKLLCQFARRLPDYFIINLSANVWYNDDA